VATDYDAPRKTDEELAEDSLEELKAQRAEATNPQVTCIKCFLVMHRSRIAKETKGKAVCIECA
jgi:hypothetical protein